MDKENYIVSDGERAAEFAANDVGDAVDQFIFFNLDAKILAERATIAVQVISPRGQVFDVVQFLNKQGV